MRARSVGDINTLLGNRAGLTSQRQSGWRSDLTDQLVIGFAREHGLEVVSSAKDLHHKNEFLSVLAKPAGQG
jgi:hypothetical protein